MPAAGGAVHSTCGRLQRRANGCTYYRRSGWNEARLAVNTRLLDTLIDAGLVEMVRFVDDSHLSGCRWLIHGTALGCYALSHHDALQTIRECR